MEMFSSENEMTWAFERLKRAMRVLDKGVHRMEITREVTEIKSGRGNDRAFFAEIGLVP